MTAHKVRPGDVYRVRQRPRFYVVEDIVADYALCRVYEDTSLSSGNLSVSLKYFETDLTLIREGVTGRDVTKAGATLSAPPLKRHAADECSVCRDDKRMW